MFKKITVSISFTDHEQAALQERLKNHNHLKATVEFNFFKITIILAGSQKSRRVIKLKYSLTHPKWRQFTYKKGQTSETKRK